MAERGFGGREDVLLAVLLGGDAVELAPEREPVVVDVTLVGAEVRTCLADRGEPLDEVAAHALLEQRAALDDVEPAEGLARIAEDRDGGAGRDARQLARGEAEREQVARDQAGAQQLAVIEHPRDARRVLARGLERRDQAVGADELRRVVGQRDVPPEQVKPRIVHVGMEVPRGEVELGEEAADRLHG